jgi:hypothetical protein
MWILTSRVQCANYAEIELRNSRSILQGRLVVSVAVLVARITVHTTEVGMDDGLLR